MVYPENLERLHFGEEEIRDKALSVIAASRGLQLHLAAVERTMDLADIFRQFPTDDEDLKVAQILGMRTFNAFGAGLKLALSGYSQNSALIMRDVLETVFLLDLFQSDRTLITRWRHADKKELREHFSPVKVREALDTRDGFTSKRRAEIYTQFCELAGHPTMKSALMMRPVKSGDAVIGPFVEATMLEAVLSEMGRLAVQVGEVISRFCPSSWKQAVPSRIGFARTKRDWLATFYPSAVAV